MKMKQGETKEVKYEKGKLLVEGKTKKIFEVVGCSDLVWVEYKNTITKHDNPDLTKEFETKARLSNKVNTKVFLLLKQAGIPVAFVKELSSTEFIARKCDMIGLEVVMRRFAVGSYLKRSPSLKKAKGEVPKRFHRLVIEFFLKTTKGKLINSSGKLLIDGLDPKKGEEDPYIPNPKEDEWKLHHSKKPLWDPNVYLGSVQRNDVLGEHAIDYTRTMIDVAKRVFLVLEGAWNTLGHRLIDMKIEFGVTKEEKLIVADVIDNDSWRLRTSDWERLSKEAFRQNEALSEVEKKYGIVASLVEKWRIPSQALIIWRGSKKDSLPEIPEINNCSLSDIGVGVELVTLSGHKSTRQALDKLDELVGKYPDGGVIFVKVGMSNGLGPILATHVLWPVINLPASLKDFPNDIWSSTRMPSKVPCATINREQNAILFALNVLAIINPCLYAFRQKEIEELDY